jgi:hypothetical protein
MTPSISSGFSRRDFLQLAASATGAAALHPTPAFSAPGKESALIDTNVAIGAWPFRRGPLADTAALVDKLRGAGVAEAWAGSLDALLHKDIGAVNQRLAEECRRFGGGLLRPFGALHPKLSGWEEDLRRCAEVHRMPGIRLHPNYHGYTLAEPLFERVLGRATELGLLVQIAVIMEDERTIHPLVNVPPTATAPLAEVLKRLPRARVQLLNAFRTLRGSPLLGLAAQGVRFEIATLEGVEGVANLLKQLPPDRLCFGSFAPVFYFEAATLKLRESELTAAQQRAVSFATARAFLART